MSRWKSRILKNSAKLLVFGRRDCKFHFPGWYIYIYMPRYRSSIFFSNVSLVYMLETWSPKRASFCREHAGLHFPHNSKPILFVRKLVYLYCLHFLFWLVVSTPLKNISQLGLLFPIYGKITNVPNHHPVLQSWRRVKVFASPNTRGVTRCHHMRPTDLVSHTRAVAKWCSVSFHNFPYLQRSPG